MKAYIASNKPKNKDVEVEECRGNLAWTTSCLSDSKSLSSSVLFFVLDPSMNLSEDCGEDWFTLYNLQYGYLHGSYA